MPSEKCRIAAAGQHPAPNLSLVKTSQPFWTVHTCIALDLVAAHLGLEQMVKVNTDNHCTAFTVSIDHVDTTTGISAAERGYTCRKCVDTSTRPEDLRRPGHVLPLVARRGGVLTRNGHTEATVDLCRLAGLHQCGLCCEIMREDGTMMRTTELLEKARE